MFGAACTLSHMGAVLKQAVETLPPHQTEVFLAVLEQLRWFAGMQIRNVAVSHSLSVGALTLTEKGETVGNLKADPSQRVLQEPWEI